ncbi:MAG: hypothetical protein AAGM22_29515, partial [Acidobacteriota bacterium]
MSESQQASEPLSQQQEELDRHVADQVESLVSALHQKLGERVQAANQEVLKWLEQKESELPTSFFSGFDLAALVKPAPPEPEPVTPVSSRSLDDLLGAVAAIDRETGQAEILTALLDQCLRFASSAAFFLVRGGEVRGWASRGTEEEAAGSISAKADQAPWSEMLAANAATALDAEAATGIAANLGAGSVNAGLLIPFSIRGQVSGALWAGGGEASPLEADALQLLTHAAAMALETASVSPGPSPALAPLHGELPVVAPPEVEAPEEVEAAEAEPRATDDGAGVGDEEPAQISTFAEAENSDPEFVSESNAEETVAGPEAGDASADADPVAEEPGPGHSESATAEEAPPEAASVNESPDDADADYLPTEDDIALEAEPEPELEDTNIWELEEDGEAEEEPTQVGHATTAVEPEPEPEPEVAAAEVSPPPAVGQETVRIDLATIQEDQAALARESQSSDDPGDETSPTMHAYSQAPASETPPAEPAPTASNFASPPPADFSAPQPGFTEPAPTPQPSSFTDPPPPAPAPEPKPEAAAGSTEVVPPPDLDGPGLAFATPEPAAAEPRVNEGDAALHEEARRLARLLVSEIKLYNEEIIEEGRRSGNI